ncbi:type II secretion system protein [Pseudanabaena sp. FACHB-1998]|uniref:pilus assembly FimT family protein n=1 Tax=Pseudanabaena sp. FACHB-1998 TaxID=2692858 RepID=UPI0016810AA7|nr:type II secretion system protein [Pseudanabaena sp. FACHB-1998]MBD2178359.1 type II secretion system protein [Pseudanabaena sp. FACHB-1998]
MPITRARYLRYLHNNLSPKSRLPPARRHRRFHKRSHNLGSGFTLLELLVALAFVGILTAIASPSWLGFSSNQSLNSAQTIALSSLRLAQSKSKQEQLNWQVSFRNTVNRAQYAVHKTPTFNTTAAYWDGLPWESFDIGVRIVEDIESQPRTTFTKLSAVPEPDVYRVKFDAKGNVDGLGELGRITFSSKVGDRRKCVIISTVLGVMRSAVSSSCNQT